MAWSRWVDNGPELVSNALERWPGEHGVPPDSSRPGRQIDRGFVESFNSSLRE